MDKLNNPKYSVPDDINIVPTTKGKKTLSKYDIVYKFLRNYITTPMLLPEQAIDVMKNVIDSFHDDREALHIEMDKVLLSILYQNGYDKVIEMFINTPKWYA